MKRLIVKHLSVLLSFVMLISIFTGCKSRNYTFPELSYPTDETTETTVLTSDVSDDLNASLIELTVALPYSENTINSLFRLYYAKQNALMPDETTGATIDLDYLNAIDIPWIINPILTTFDGATKASVSTWRNNGTLPDLFLTSDAQSLDDLNAISTLNNYLSDNPYLSSNSINSNAVLSSISDGDMLSVPHYSSVMLIAGNCDYIPSEETMSFRPTLDEFYNYLDVISDENSDSDESLVVFTHAYELFPYLSSSFGNDALNAYMFMDLMDSDSVDFDGAIEYIEDIYSSDYSDPADSASDPRFSRNAALWLISSSEVTMWANYYLDNLYYALIPCSDSSNDAVLYTTYYSLCVSSTCEHKDLAADFAAFISFDTDAIELIWRLEQISGYFPVVNNDAVWDIVSEDPYFGTESLVIRQYINNVVVCPSNASDLYQSANSYCSNYFDSMRDDAEEFNFEEEWND